MFDATDGGPAVVDVDARLAKAQECLRDLHQCAPTIDVKVHMDSYHWLIAFLPAVLDQLSHDLYRRYARALADAGLLREAGEQ